MNTPSLYSEIQLRGPQIEWKHIVIKRGKNTFYVSGHVPIGNSTHTFILKKKNLLYSFDGSSFAETGVQEAIDFMKTAGIILASDVVTVIPTTQKEYIHDEKWSSLFKKGDMLFFWRNSKPKEKVPGYPETDKQWQLAIYTQDDDGSLKAKVHYRTADGDENDETIDFSEISSPVVVTSTSLMRDFATCQSISHGYVKCRKEVKELEKKYEELNKSFLDLLRLYLNATDSGTGLPIEIMSNLTQSLQRFYRQ